MVNENFAWECELENVQSLNQTESYVIFFCATFFPVKNKRDVVNVAFYKFACEGVGEHEKRHDQAYSFKNGTVVGIFTD